jgi:hypothetical protein
MADANPIRRVDNKIGVSQCRALWARVSYKVKILVYPLFYIKEVRNMDKSKAVIPEVETEYAQPMVFVPCYCPSCGKEVPYTNYCCECGQKFGKCKKDRAI